MTPEDREAALAARIHKELTTSNWSDGRIEVVGPWLAVLSFGRGPNHTLHLLLSAATLGVWLVVWAWLGYAKRQRRVLVYLASDDQVHVQQLK